ncbi:GNAT family N-acetyltransferase [Victivallis vadensis]|uniref:GNAT family N-acetyltransferase n=1 Tax=Victivallis vadensis TaxID=172901 RepID=UPI0023F47282|nr:GNAT family N-acetyltransferase [Victivallis vadensis]
MENDFKFEGWVLQKVNPSLCLASFDCGDEPMNRYFRKYSSKYRRALLAQSYSFHPLESDPAIPIFLVDFCNDNIRREVIADFKSVIHHDKRRLKTYPAVKIARLGLAKSYRGNHYGDILLNAVKMFFLTNNRTGCRFITVDAYRNMERFYSRNGFMRTLDGENGNQDNDTISMFFDLLPLRNHLEAKNSEVASA